MIYVALRPQTGPKPDPLGVYVSMKAAQDAIAEAEPNVLLQALYQIHPLASQKDADALYLKVTCAYRLEKFNGEYVGQEPTEVIEGVG
jgi:hypothetical protein